MNVTRGLLALVILAAALAAGCGDGGAPSTMDTADSTPPALSVSDPLPGAWVTTASYTFTGTTEPGADVVAADRYPAEVDADGGWTVVLMLQPGRNLVSFTAIDSAGNETVGDLTVFYEIPMAELIVGSWIGEVTVPRTWHSIADFWVEFRADGSYSADAAGGDGPPFSFADPSDDPEQVYSVDGQYPDGQPGSGWIDIVWESDGTVATSRGSLENISFSEGGDRLHFEFWANWGGRWGPFVYDLRRGSRPPQTTSTNAATSSTTATTTPPTSSTALPSSTTLPATTTPTSSTAPTSSITPTSEAAITTPVATSTTPLP